MDLAQHWRAWQYNGHPVAYLAPVCVEHLDEADKWFNLLETQLTHLPSIASLLVFPPMRGDLRFTSEPTPHLEYALVPTTSPRESALRESELLSDSLTHAKDELIAAQQTYRYQIWFGCPGWGDPPPDMVLAPIPIPADFAQRLSHTVHRCNRLGKAVRDYQKLLRDCVEFLEDHPVGTLFFFPGSRIVHALAPLIVKVKRDNTGAWFAIDEGEHHRLRSRDWSHRDLLKIGEKP